jgi:hypothetical protein
MQPIEHFSPGMGRKAFEELEESSKFFLDWHLSKWEKKNNSSISKRKKKKLDDQFFLDRMTDLDKEYMSENDKKVFVNRMKMSHMLREMGYSAERLSHLKRTLWTKNDEQDIVTV